MRTDAVRGLPRDTFHCLPSGQRVSLRWILCHLIEECARHNDQANLLRESIDGVTVEERSAAGDRYRSTRDVPGCPAGATATASGSASDDVTGVFVINEPHPA